MKRKDCQELIYFLIIAEAFIKFSLIFNNLQKIYFRVYQLVLKGFFGFLLFEGLYFMFEGCSSHFL